MKTLNNYSKQIGFLAILIVATILLFSSSCTSSSSEPTSNEVFIQNMAFSPATLTVKAGTTVKWTNKDGIAHTVTSDTGIFDSGNLNSNLTFSYMFMNTGTFSYHCTTHPSMTAKIVVN